MGAFEIYRARRGEYRFRYRASTGEIVATSAAYSTKAEARTALAAVFRAADGSSHADDHVLSVDGVGGVGSSTARKAAQCGDDGR